MTADVYFNFDTAAPFKDLKGTPKHNMSISGPSKVLHVPDRSSPVIFMAPKSSSGSGRFTSPSRGSSCAVYVFLRLLVSWAGGGGLCNMFIRWTFTTDIFVQRAWIFFDGKKIWGPS